MRPTLGSGLAVVAVLHGSTAWADPSTPQLSPIHRQREDAQRLREQQRGLDRDRPAAAMLTRPSELPAPRAITGSPVMRGVGFALLALAGVSALLALETSDSGDTSSAWLATSALSGLTGLVLVVSNRSVQVAPAVTSRGVGLSIMGAL